MLSFSDHQQASLVHHQQANEGYLRTVQKSAKTVLGVLHQTPIGHIRTLYTLPVMSQVTLPTTLPVISPVSTLPVDATTLPTTIEL